MQGGVVFTRHVARSLQGNPERGCVTGRAIASRRELVKARPEMGGCDGDERGILREDAPRRSFRRRFLSLGL